MKSMAIVTLTFAAATAFAAPKTLTSAKTEKSTAATTTTATTTETSSSSTANSSTLVAPNPTTEIALENHTYISTNFIDLSQGHGNLAADFFTSDKFAATFRFENSSEKETVTKGGEKGKITVERTSYALGVTFFPMGMNNKVNLMISPAVAFGTTKDAIDVDRQTGISIKTTGMVKFKSNFAGEVGLKADNLKNGDFVGNLHAGIGYLF